MFKFKSNYVEVMPYDIEKQEPVGDTAIFEGFIHSIVTTRNMDGYYKTSWYTEIKLIGVDGKSEILISGELKYSAEGVWILQQDTKKKHALAVVEIDDEEDWED